MTDELLRAPQRSVPQMTQGAKIPLEFRRYPRVGLDYSVSKHHFVAVQGGDVSSLAALLGRFLPRLGPPPGGLFVFRASPALRLFLRFRGPPVFSRLATLGGRAALADARGQSHTVVMDLDSPIFDRIRVRPRAEDTHGTDAPQCQHQGCTQAGDFRAPKGRGQEGRFWHFCLDHVRSYNQTYN